MKRLFLSIVLVLSGFVGTAVAGTSQSNHALTSISDNDCAKARKAGRACQLVFDGDTVNGDRVGGDGDLVSVAEDAKFDNLIKVRSSFRDMIVKSAESL